jgi:hypothetical protein
LTSFRTDFQKWIRDIESAAKRTSAGYKQARLLCPDEGRTLEVEREIAIRSEEKKDLESAVLRPKNAEKCGENDENDEFFLKGIKSCIRKAENPA